MARTGVIGGGAFGTAMACVIRRSGRQTVRNTSLGVALGEGRKLADVLAECKEVTEAVFSAEAVVELVHRLAVPMPISEAVDAIRNHAAALDATIARSVASCPLSHRLHAGNELPTALPNPMLYSTISPSQ